MYYRLLLRKPLGNITLGRPRRRWEDNVCKNLDGYIELINVAQGRDRLYVVAVVYM
jgi:hypothetical protein